MVSLITASVLAPLATAGAADYVNLALFLALLVGLLQVVMGIARLGFLVNFLSHPVISGFTSAAALVIGFGQAKHLLGIALDRPERPYQVFMELARGPTATNVVTLGLGAGSIGILLFFQFGLKDLLQRVGVAKPLAIALPKSGPLASVGTVTLVGLTVTFLTPMFYYIPHAVLAAVINQSYGANHENTSSFSLRSPRARKPPEASGGSLVLRDAVDTGGGAVGGDGRI
jgi:MFS superfamily sulfate permease-like transporter